MLSRHFFLTAKDHIPSRIFFLVFLFWSISLAVSARQNYYITLDNGFSCDAQNVSDDLVYVSDADGNAPNSGAFSLTLVDERGGIGFYEEFYLTFNVVLINSEYNVVTHTRCDNAYVEFYNLFNVQKLVDNNSNFSISWDDPGGSTVLYGPIDFTSDALGKASLTIGPFFNTNFDSLDVYPQVNEMTGPVPQEFILLTGNSVICDQMAFTKEIYVDGDMDPDNEWCQDILDNQLTDSMIDVYLPLSSTDRVTIIDNRRLEHRWDQDFYYFNLQEWGNYRLYLSPDDVFEGSDTRDFTVYSTDGENGFYFPCDFRPDFYGPIWTESPGNSMISHVSEYSSSTGSRIIELENAAPGWYGLRVFDIASMNVDPYAVEIERYHLDPEISAVDDAIDHQRVPQFNIKKDPSFRFRLEIALAEKLISDSSFQDKRIPEGSSGTFNGDQRNYYISPWQENDVRTNLQVNLSDLNPSVWQEFRGSVLYYRLVTEDHLGIVGKMTAVKKMQIENWDWYGQPVNDVTEVRVDDAVSIKAVVNGVLQGAAIGSDYGPRNASEPTASKFHPGIDLPFAQENNPVREPIYAVADGVIHRTNTEPTLPNGVTPNYNRVIVAHKNSDVDSDYLHMSVHNLLNDGDEVKQGQLIGYSGWEGLPSTKNHHLHFEVGAYTLNDPINPAHKYAYKNPLVRLPYTDDQDLAIHSALLGNKLTLNEEICFAPAFADSNKVIVGLGVTTELDRDLDVVSFRVDNHQGSNGDGKYFQLDYSAVQGDGVYGENGCPQDRSIVCLDGTNFKIAFWNTNQSISDPEYTDGGIFNEASLVFPCYVRPGPVNSRGLFPTEWTKDYFYFIWDLSDYGPADGSHQVTVEVRDVNDGPGQGFLRQVRIGPELSLVAGPHFSNGGNTVSYELDVSAYQPQAHVATMVTLLASSPLSNFDVSFSPALTQGRDPFPFAQILFPSEGTQRVTMSLTRNGAGSVDSGFFGLGASFDPIPSLRDRIGETLIFGTDLDGDGILDDVDPDDGNQMNDSFQNGLGTSGTIDRGDQNLVVVNDGDGGVIVVAQDGGGAEPAEITPCDSILVTELASGQKVQISCGSTRIRSLAGDIDGYFNNGQVRGTLRIPEGNSLRFDESKQFFSADGGNSQSITITLMGETFDLAPGERLSLLILMKAKKLNFLFEDYVAVSETAALDAIDGDFTIEAWYKADEDQHFPHSFHPHLFSSGGNLEVMAMGGSEAIPLPYAWILFMDNRGLNNNARAFDGVWHHFAATKQGDRVTYYVDGTARNSHQDPFYSAFDLKAGSSFTIGSALPTSVNESLLGSIQDLRIWGYARSGTQIATHMYRHLTGNESGLVHYFRLDEGAGQSVPDYTGNATVGILGAGNDIDANDPQWDFLDSPFLKATLLAGFTAEALDDGSVQFSDTSVSMDGIQTWEWDFDRDGVVDSYDPNPNHTFIPDTGTAFVSLRVGDGNTYDAYTAAVFTNQDVDGDGIFNTVDTMPLTVSTAFKNASTQGVLSNSSDHDQNLVVRAGNPGGIHASADLLGGATPATLTLFADLASFQLGAGTELQVQSGLEQVSIQVSSGLVPASFNVFGLPADLDLPAGHSLQFGFDNSGAYLEASSLNTAVLSIGFNGNTYDLAPGDRVYLQNPAAEPSLSFDGFDDTLTVRDSGTGLNMIGTDDFTLEAWVRFEGSPTGHAIQILSNTRENQEDQGFQWGFESDGVSLLPYLQMGSKRWYSPQIADVADGNWHHLAVARDTTLKRLYFYADGQRYATIYDAALAHYDLALDPAPAEPSFRIGGAPGGGVFPGRIRQVRVWNRTRDQIELNATKDVSLRGNEDGLLHSLPMNEGIGQIQDQTANGHAQHGQTPGDANDDRDPLWRLAAPILKPIGDLVAHYSFDRHGFDLSGTGNSASILNAGWTKSLFGHALDLQDAFIGLGNKQELRPDWITLSAWIRPDDASVGQRQIVTQEDFGYRFAYEQNGISLVIKDPDAFGASVYGEIGLAATDLLVPGVWYHVAATYGSDRVIRLFLNGMQVAQRTASSGGDGKITYAGNLQTSLGRGDDATGWRTPFEGHLDEVKIWRVALNPAEIQQEYASYGEVDRDMDHIFDSVDTEPENRTNFRFSDLPLGGTAEGIILNPTEHNQMNLAIRDLVDGGVLASTYGLQGSLPVRIKACNTTFELDGTDAVEINCGSVIARALEGSIVIQLLGDDGTPADLTLEAGNGFIFHTDTLAITADADNSQSLQVVAGSGTIQVDPGRTEYLPSAPASLSPDFQVSATEGVLPLNVGFTDLSTANGTAITAWAWDFDGDGQVDATQADPSYSYTRAGTYTVSLTVSDGRRSATYTRPGLIRVTHPLPQVSADGLNAHYPLDGSADDLSSYANHGVISGAVPAADRHGQASGAIKFDGVDDVVRFGDMPQFRHGTGDFSLTLWFYYDGTPQKAGLITKRNPNPPYDQYSLMIHSGNPYGYAEGNKLSAFIRSTGANRDRVISASDNDPLDVGWHFAALITDYDGVTGLYLDGKKLGEHGGSFAGYPLDVPGWPLESGYVYADDYFRGKLDDIRVYGRALSEREIQILYRPESPLATPIDLRLSDVTSSSVHLSWRDVALYETGYLVERAIGNLASFETIALLPAGSETLVDSALPPNTAVHYRVKALGGMGDSAYSNLAQTKTRKVIAGDQDLVGYFPFSGDAKDESAYENDGILAGAAGITSDRFGHPNRAVSLNGSSDAVVFGDQPEYRFGTGDFSLSAWFYFDGNPRQTFLLSKRLPYEPFEQYSISIHAGNPYALSPGKRLSVFMRPLGASYDRWVSSPDLTVGWHHVVAVNDYDQKLTVYLDNQVIGAHTRDFGGLPIDVTGQALRATYQGSSGFIGKLDEIRIYRRALDASEVDHLFNEQASDGDRDGDGLFDEIDEQPDLYSAGFSDANLGGGSSGLVLTRGDQDLKIVDDAVSGLWIGTEPGGGPAPAQVSLCGGSAVFYLDAGEELIATCGSVIAHSLRGDIEVVFLHEGQPVASTVLPAGQGITFDSERVALSAWPANQLDLIVVAGNRETILAPGDDYLLNLGHGGGNGDSVPVADDLTILGQEDRTIQAQLSGSDADGDPLFFNVVGAPLLGSLHLDGATGFFTYSPHSDVYGMDSFTFTAGDGRHESPPATVSISLAAVNDRPQAATASHLVSADGLLSGRLSAYDVDGDFLTFSLVQDAALGILEVQQDGMFFYVPSTEDPATDQFIFRVHDGQVFSNEALVTVEITPAGSNGTAYHWRFDENGGNTVVDDQYGLHGLLTGGVDWVNEPLAGNGALAFDGSNGTGVDLGEALALHHGEPFTFSMWLSPDTITGQQTLLSKMVDGGDARGWALELAANKIVFEMRHAKQGNNSLAVSAEAGLLTAVPGWHHLAITYDGSRSAAGFTFYLDGVAAAGTVRQDRLSGPIECAASTVIGGRDSGRFSYAGLMDELMVFDSAKSAEEIALLADPYQLGLKAGYSFEEHGFDGTDGAHHLQLVGGVRFGDGPVGRAAFFNGRDASESLAGFPLAGSRRATIAFWLQAEGDQPQTLLRGHEADAAGVAVVAGAGWLGLDLEAGAESQELVGASIPADSWVHVAILVDERETCIYLDGERIACSSGLVLPADMGLSWELAPDFTGGLDELLLYDRVLRPLEIKGLAGLILQP